MPNQFIIVNFPEERDVLSGGVVVGGTNALLTINGGTHTFTLADPQDYEPTQQKLVVAGTSVGEPLEIDFFLKQSGPADPDLPPAPTRGSSPP